jgi:lactoylglutathione lyase
MSLNILGLRTVIYRTDDLLRAKEWYTTILGFKPYFDEPFYVCFNVGGYELGLIPAEGTADEIKTTNVTPYWGVRDIKSSFDELLKQGATPFEEPADVGGDIIVATVLDPWGNTFGLIHNPHFSIPT